MCICVPDHTSPTMSAFTITPTDVLGYMLHPLTAAVGNAFNTNIDCSAFTYTVQRFKSTPEYSVTLEAPDNQLRIANGTWRRLSNFGPYQDVFWVHACKTRPAKPYRTQQEEARNMIKLPLEQENPTQVCEYFGDSVYDGRIYFKMGMYIAGKLARRLSFKLRVFDTRTDKEIKSMAAGPFTVDVDPLRNELAVTVQSVPDTQTIFTVYIMDGKSVSLQQSHCANKEDMAMHKTRQAAAIAAKIADAANPPSTVHDFVRLFENHNVAHA